ncbi:MAG: hypothetical protein ABFC96_13035 [Thermoguttaceae bacterium]
MSTLVLACALLPSLVQGSLPDGPLSSIQKEVAQCYGKTEQSSVACLVYVKDVYAPAQLCFGAVEYRFDRRAKRLAVGAQGQAGLLVKDNKLFVLLCHENNGEVPIYLEVTKAHAITWKDVDEARHLIRKECPLADGSSSYCIPCFVWPFLDDGAERLFSPGAALLKKGDVNQGRTIINREDPLASIFDWGHPDLKHVLVPQEDNPDRIDPKRRPVCIKTQDAAGTWAYAFERETGTLCAAIGEVDRREVLAVPGNRLLVVMKRVASFPEDDGANGEFKPMPLELPKNAKIVGAAGLKSAYYSAMADKSMPSLGEMKEQVESELQAAVERESRAMAGISRLEAIAGKEQKELDSLRKELEGARGDKVTCSYVKKELQTLIDELRRREKRQLRKTDPATTRGSTSGDAAATRRAGGTPSPLAPG